MIKDQVHLISYIYVKYNFYKIGWNKKKSVHVFKQNSKHAILHTDDCKLLWSV